MRIKTRGHVNGRTADGRVYSAGEGAVTEIDDNDEGMVALMRGLAAEGQVDIIEPEPEPPEDLDALRAEAEAAGLKIDKRWGADRLSLEIAAAKAEANPVEPSDSEATE